MKELFHKLEKDYLNKIELLSNSKDHFQYRNYIEFRNTVEVKSDLKLKLLIQYLQKGEIEFASSILIDLLNDCFLLYFSDFYEDSDSLVEDTFSFLSKIPYPQSNFLLDYAIYNAEKIQIMETFGTYLSYIIKYINSIQGIDTKIYHKKIQNILLEEHDNTTFHIGVSLNTLAIKIAEWGDIDCALEVIKDVEDFYEYKECIDSLVKSTGIAKIAMIVAGRGEPRKGLDILKSTDYEQQALAGFSDLSDAYNAIIKMLPEDERNSEEFVKSLINENSNLNDSVQPENEYEEESYDPGDYFAKDSYEYLHEMIPEMVNTLDLDDIFSKFSLFKRKEANHLYLTLLRVLVENSNYSEALSIVSSKLGIVHFYKLINFASEKHMQFLNFIEFEKSIEELFSFQTKRSLIYLKNIYYHLMIQNKNEIHSNYFNKFLEIPIFDEIALDSYFFETINEITKRYDWEPTKLKRYIFWSFRSKI